MKTMDCATLEQLLENHEQMDLIDIRSKKDFAAMHIPGAHSIPFEQLAAPSPFVPWRRRTNPVYIVSDDSGEASLVVGILRTVGYINAAVVEGGMKSWLANGYPVWAETMLFKLPFALRAGALLVGFAAAIAIAFGKFLIAGLILVSAAALLLKSLFLARTVREQLYGWGTKPCPT